MTARDPWNGILDEGESILWQGRPDGAIALRPSNLFTLLFGCVFAGFALFWMKGAMQAGGNFWAFGLLHFSVGIGIVIQALFWDAFRRRRSWYTLTDRRAFIATDIPVMGRGLKSYPITRDTTLELIDRTPPSVIFATRTKRTKNGSQEIPVGFERISEGREVYRQMRDIQTQASDRSSTS